MTGPSDPTQAPAAGSRTRAFDAAALLFCAALAALYLTRQCLDGDEAVFAAIGMRIQHLGLPAYDAGWDHKPPGIFHVYAALLSPWDRFGLLPLHVASAAAWLATAWICGAAARRVAGALAFAPAVAAYGLLRSFGETKAGAANTEAFLSPLVAGGVFLILLGASRRTLACAAGGALLACAALLKPNAAVFGPATVLAVGVVRGGRAGVVAGAAGAAGAAAVLLPVAATLASNGTLPDAVWLTVDANRIYMAHAPALGAAGHVAAFLREVGIAAAPWLLSVVACGVALLRPAAWPEASAGAVRRAAIAALCLFAAGCASVAAGGLYFRHYWWMLHPVLAVCCALGVVSALRVVRPRALALGVLALVVGLLWVPAQWTDKRRLFRSFLFDATVEPPYGGRSFVDAAAAIQRLATPGETIWIWGSNPELYVMADRVPASRHISAHLLTGALRPDVRSGAAPPDPDVCPRGWSTLEADLRASPPAVIVDSSATGYRGYDRFPVGAFPRIARILDESYALAEHVGGYVLWVRRSR